jgi:hypothetical protein
MLWVLPINILVLLVWAHNLVVHWFMPFSSHHNVLSIMPFIILVETMTTGSMIPRVTTRYVSFPRLVNTSADPCRFKHVTSVLLFCIAVYSAVYGVSYAYISHHLVNILAGWLVSIYCFRSGFSLHRFWKIVEGDETPSSPESGSHMKKKP